MIQTLYLVFINCKPIKNRNRISKIIRYILFPVSYAKCKICAFICKGTRLFEKVSGLTVNVMLWFYFIRDCFWFIRNSYAFICEYNALHIENIRYILFPVPYAKCAFICESFGFIRKRYAFTRECFLFIRNRYAFICETNALHIESTRFLRYACIWEMLLCFWYRETRVVSWKFHVM